jgi:hypothetical protein
MGGVEGEYRYIMLLYIPLLPLPLPQRYVK